jgi:hypothetical protein
MRADAFWRAHLPALGFAGGAVAAYGLYRAAHAAATAAGAATDTPAGRARVAACVGGGAGVAALALRRRLALPPAAAHRVAMARFNADPGVLEVLGAPLAGGGGPRAVVETGGGLRARPGSLLPSWRPRRVHMAFPLAGAERTGVASLEAVKRGGGIEFKLLMVDVPTRSGGEARVFLEGGPHRADAGALLDTLRQPLVRAAALGRAHAAEDGRDDAAAAAAAAAADRATAAAAALEGPKTASWWQPKLRPW